MALTRTPFVAHSRASHSVKLRTAALAAEYATTRDSGIMADMEAILMMLPRPAATIVSPKTWHGSNAPPMRLRSKTPCQPVIGSLQKSPPGAMRRVRPIAARSVDQNADRPPLLRDRIARRDSESRSRASAAWNIALPPAASMLRTRSLPRSSLRPTTATRAPAAGQRLGHRPAKDARTAQDDGDFAFQIKQIVFHRYPCTNSGFRWRS